MPRLLMDLTPLRVSVPYRRMWLGTSLSGIGTALTNVVVGLQVYEITGSTPTSGATGVLWAAAGCMVLAGAADSISAIFRSTILQAATPDALRGRLQGVFIVVVAGGPRLGDLVLGTLGSAAGEAAAAILGGVACAIGVVVFSLAQRGFLRYDALDPVP